MSSKPPEQMTRPELETEVSELRAELEEVNERLDRVERAAAVVSRFVRELDGVDDHNDGIDHGDPSFIGHAIPLVEAFVDDANTNTKFVESYGEGRARDQDEAWMQIVNAAHNLDGNPNHSIPNSSKVQLFIENIAQATGYTKRHCSNLIEEYGDSKESASWKPHQPASENNKGNSRRKHLVVDVDYWEAYNE